MRTFEQLSSEDREDTLSNTTMWLIHEIITGVLEIEFVNAKNKKAFDEIMKEAGAQDSVRYAQYAMHKHNGIRSEIEKIALIICTESCYDKDGNLIKDESPKEKLS